MIPNVQSVDRKILRDEIQLKAGPLWANSVVRLRDRAANQILDLSVVDKLSYWTLTANRRVQKTYFTASAANTLTPLLEQAPNRFLDRAKVLDLHNSILNVNDVFYKGIVQSIDSNAYTRTDVANSLEKLLNGGVKRVYDNANALLEAMQESFQKLIKPAQLVIDKLSESNMPLEIACLLDFMQGLILPNNVSPQESEIAKILSNTADISTQKKYIENDVPELFKSWSEEIQESIQTWWKQAQESYSKVIRHLNFDVRNN